MTKNVYIKNAIAAMLILSGTFLFDNSVAVKADTQPVTMYRLYNTRSGQHLQTIDTNEVNALLANPSWKEEASTFRVYDNCTDGGSNVTNYISRFLGNNGQHFLTADFNEQDILIQKVSTYHYYQEANPFGYGCVSMSQVSGTVPVYRTYNNISGEHLLSADLNEINNLNGRNHWSTEAVAFYAYP